MFGLLFRGTFLLSSDEDEESEVNELVPLESEPLDDELSEYSVRAAAPRARAAPPLWVGVVRRPEAVLTPIGETPNELKNTT